MGYRLLANESCVRCNSEVSMNTSASISASAIVALVAGAACPLSPSHVGKISLYMQLAPSRGLLARGRRGSNASGREGGRDYCCMFCSHLTCDVEGFSGHLFISSPSCRDTLILDQTFENGSFSAIDSLGQLMCHGS